MKVMDWVRKLTDIIMPLEPVEEEEEAKEAKKSEAKTVELKPEQMSQEAQPATAQNYQADKRTAAGGVGFGGSMSFTRNGGMVTTAENGVTSMGGVRYEAYSAETSVRPSLAVVKTPQLTVKVYTPTKYDEQVKSIVDDLMKKNAVIVNFEGMEDIEQQRIGDFVIGAVYMIKGKAEMITSKIILYMPGGIEYETAAAVPNMRRYN